MVVILPYSVLLKAHSTILHLRALIFGLCHLLPSCRLQNDLLSDFSSEVLGRSAN